MTAACSQGARPPLPVCRAPCDTHHAGVHTLRATGMCTRAQTHTCSRRAARKSRPRGESLSPSCALSCESRRDPDTRVDVRFGAAPPVLAVALAAPSPAPGRGQGVWRDGSLSLERRSLGPSMRGARAPCAARGSRAPGRPVSGRAHRGPCCPSPPEKLRGVGLCV